MLIHSTSAVGALRTILIVPTVTPKTFISTGVARLRGWAERSRQRRAVADLDDHLLEDIGISRAEAAAESAKPFWR